MKKQLIYIIIILLSFALSYNTTLAGDKELSHSMAENVRNNTCVPFFKALKNGDVKTIIAYSSGEFYRRYKVLLEQNPTYPQFLRDYYRGVEFQPGKIVREGNDLIVDVLIISPNGNQNTQKLRLSKPVANSKNWKIKGMAKGYQ